MQGPEHPESSTTRPKQPPGQAGRYQQSQTAILLSWISGICHSDRSAPTPGRGNGRVLRDEGSLVHVSRSDMSSHTDLLQQSLILHKERLLPCQREQSCLNCLCSGREPHPLLSPSKPTGSHTKAWSGQNKPTNINHAANLPHFSTSPCPRFHSPGHSNGLQAASTKRVPLSNNKPKKPGGSLDRQEGP